ncbi:MAG: hypothetical protein OEZ04_13740 [Nitrospinota bacterium]|nr:hypothetical protein [Nitrospinota bacterium]
MGWYVTDFCDDDINIEFQFFSSKHSGQAWGPFSTKELGRYVTGALECIGGETVCMGAWSGKQTWGVGKANDRYCEDCCGTCNGISYTFSLHCNSGSQAAR